MIKKINLQFQYLLLLKHFNYEINYKNILLLKYFLTSSGKIISHRKTNISFKIHKKITKAIKKARYYKLLPYTLLLLE
jgi:ribosomal protein S18